MKYIYNILVEKKKLSRIPVWFMRQAGRYLPEYRDIRKNYSHFMDFVQNAPDAARVTLQPLERYDLDAAIIFSDILVIPHALGWTVTFTPGEGPSFKPFQTHDDLKALSKVAFKHHVTPTLEALTLVKSRLASHQTLIGFAGGLWTVAAYMIQGGGSKDFAQAISLAYTQPLLMQELLAILEEATYQYLSLQVQAGADVLQVFESWAGLVPYSLFPKVLIEPTQRLLRRLKAQHPQTPLIVFPRAVGRRLDVLMQAWGPYVDGWGLDQYDMPCAQSFSGGVFQGGLDPLMVAAGPETLEEQVVMLLDHYKNRPFIFNTGHGMVPYTPPENLERVIAAVRAWEGQHEQSCHFI